MTDHEIDQLSRMTWTHKELLEAGILPLTQRETGELFGVSYQRIQQIERRALKKIAKLQDFHNTHRRHLEAIADVEDERRRRTRLCGRRIAERMLVNRERTPA